MNISKKRIGTIRAVIFFCLPAALNCAHAAAATVTYSFDEAGWVNSAGTTENFFGLFTGTPDAQGALTLASLATFSATLTETNSANDTKTIGTFGGAAGTNGLTNFLYDATSNSLNLAAIGNPGAQICLGSAVNAGLCGSVPPRPQPRPGTPALPPFDGDFISSVNPALNALTTAVPTVTLVHGPVVNPVPAPSSVPEPASYALCGGVLLAISMRFGFQCNAKRQSSPQAAECADRPRRCQLEV